MRYTQPWIGNKWVEGCFILLPPFLSLLVIFLFPAVFANETVMPAYWWVALILLVDVAHVYSTLYRTYFDRKIFDQQKNRLMIIPFLSFVVGVLLYTTSPRLFWTVLAYLAVFHFVRQQYGFMRIYTRKENSSRFFRSIDAITIYTATIYPLLYWHFSGNRSFNWFVEGDFIKFNLAQQIQLVITALYVLILLIYLVKEVILVVKTATINIPRNAVIIGTIASWYFGIVYFNGDMAFTLINVVSHGIPYMALIWIFGKRNSVKNGGKFIKAVFGKYGLVIFLGFIFMLAYLEEGLWDITLWKEHTNLFGMFHFTDIQLSKALLSIIVPLLALPQVTHYVIDGFIWKTKKGEI